MVWTVRDGYGVYHERFSRRNEGGLQRLGNVIRRRRAGLFRTHFTLAGNSDQRNLPVPLKLLSAHLLTYILADFPVANRPFSFLRLVLFFIEVFCAKKSGVTRFADWFNK